MTLRLWRRGAAQREPWVAVPRIDLLERPARSSRSSLARLLLILLVAVELAAAALLIQEGTLWIQDGTLWYQERTALQEDVDRASAELDAVSGQLGARQGEIDRLEIERDGLRQRVADAADLGGSSVAWGPPMAALVALAGDGVQLHSINGNAPDQLTIVVGSFSQEPLARFQYQLQELDRPFAVQDLQWDRASEEELRLTVSVLLKP